MTAPRRLPVADPGATAQAAAAEIEAAMRRVLHGGRYILGPEVAAFEREFAAYLGCAAAVGVASGTDALELALRAIGVGPGDRVITVAHTASATAAAIAATGARIEFADIEPQTMTLDPAALDGWLAARADASVKAVVPVHLYGQPADLPSILVTAERHGLRVVEDCAQAHGATIQGRRVGGWGAAAAFSFYPTKNLGALGDGGAVVTDDAPLAERVRRLREYGWRDRYVSAAAGTNSRLDELQAAILRVKLPRLDRDNQQRRMLASHYLAGLASTRLVLPQPAPGTEPVWHQFVVRTPERDSLQAHLAAAAIDTAVLYPVPLHRQPAYRNDSVALPVTERACRELLCLPLHPALTADDVERVCGTIREWDRARG